MSYNKDKVDEVALALLFLTFFESKGVTRAWKNIDWDVTDRLHEKGWIADPKGKAKSVIITEEGEAKAKEFFEKHFSETE